MSSHLPTLVGAILLTACGTSTGTPFEEPPPDEDADNDGYDRGEDCDDGDPDISPAATERCDGIDNDCDGEIDEAGAEGESTFYVDADGDGYGSDAGTASGCFAPAGYAANTDDCDDGDAAVNPGAAEICDAADVDENCDGLADDDDPSATGQSTWYADLDGDDYGAAAGAVDACDAPVDHVDDATDCDDDDAAVNPAATETCNGIDDDCDGARDEAGATGEVAWYADDDGDLYGDAADAIMACTALGRVEDATDCDDTRPDVNPSAPEICNGTDDDCDTLVDDADPSVSGGSTWYADADGDTYGDPDTSTMSCDAPEGSVADMTDCDDDAAAINPGAAEICDAADTDEDCDGDADDADDSATGKSTWYIDADGDGGGDPDVTMLACDQPEGYVDNASDPYESATFVAFASDTDIDELVDIVAGSSAIYAVGFNTDDEPVVVSIDPGTGAIAEVLAGAPLVSPSGIALSPDGMTLYVSDIGVESTLGHTSGEVFEVDVTSGSATALGVDGGIDMPGDVALSADGSTLYVSGLDADGTAGIYVVDVGGGSVARFDDGEFDDPLALAISPDGATLYVLDSTLADGWGAIIVLDVATGEVIDELASGFDVAFPGGVAVDGTGSMVLYTAINVGALISLWADGSGSETLDTSSLLDWPTGVSVSGEIAYVVDLSPDATAQVFALSY